MTADEPALIGYATALGVGALIGIERERRKGQGRDRAFAGLRTFTLAALTGALAFSLGGVALLIAGLLVVGGIALIAFQRDLRDDPGATTEIAMLLTVLLGALAMQAASLAAAMGVLVAALLAARDPLHRWASEVLSEQELRDGLLLGVCALVLLPLMPNHTVGPFEVLNPRRLWLLLVLVLVLNAAGYVAVRALGPRLGLAFAGFASGFVSSSATIAAMGSRAVETPDLRPGAVAGASLSSLATVVQLALVIGATSPPTLSVLRGPLLAAGLVALLYGALFALRSWRASDAVPPPPGRAFRFRSALGFVALVAAVMFVSAALNAWLGASGMGIAAAMAGFADAHSPAIAAASLVAAQQLAPPQAAWPILLAFSSNALTKLLLAHTSGDRAYFRAVGPGVVAMTLAAWLGLLL